ncbi:hypothetical protein SAY86_021157 [Trapa natans]|uniref:Uncharacterized protein n=1 Tax=Trapa natans TaxID=22666 RepID=A0AAN7M7G0_TRANT|nr:hypothetical protein SAY86_021157 [Trapa natans]
MMATQNHSTARSAGHLYWRSPVPYLFGGLGVLFILIAASLVILACSNRKRTAARRTEEAGEDVVKAILRPLDMEPRIVVIMAGDDKPSFLATPVLPDSAASTSSSQLPAASSYCYCDKV